MTQQDISHRARPGNDLAAGAVPARSLTREQLAFSKVLGQILASRWRQTASRPPASNHDCRHSQCSADSADCSP
jgi:hypothetical protein